MEESQEWELPYNVIVNLKSNVTLTFRDTSLVFLETLFPRFCCFKENPKTYYTCISPKRVSHEVKGLLDNHIWVAYVVRIETRKTCVQKRLIFEWIACSTYDNHARFNNQHNCVWGGGGP